MYHGWRLPISAKGLPIIMKDISLAIRLRYGWASKLPGKQVERKRMTPAKWVNAKPYPSNNYGDFGETDIVIKRLLKSKS